MNSDWQHETPAQTDWHQWLLAHASVFMLFARQQARCEADAEDLVQEAVVESWRRQATETPPPVALVFATIRRRAVDLARSRERRAGREAAALQENDGCWFDSGVEERERDSLLHKAMSQVPIIYREVLTLKVWGGLTFAEIGETLDIPANTAASRYRYGLEELRKLTKEVLA